MPNRRSRRLVQSSWSLFALSFKGFCPRRLWFTYMQPGDPWTTIYHAVLLFRLGISTDGISIVILATLSINGWLFTLSLLHPPSPSALTLSRLEIVPGTTVYIPTLLATLISIPLLAALLLHMGFETQLRS